MKPVYAFVQRNLTTILLALIMVCTAAIYLRAIEAPFYRDDALHIKHNEVLHNPQSLTELFTKGNNFLTRYLVTGLHHLAWVAGNGKTWPFHSLNLLIHLLNGLLAFLVMRHSFPRAQGMNLFVTAVFLLHPIQVQPVVYSSKLSILLSSFFILSALLVAARWPRDREPIVPTLFLLILGLLSKEIAIIIPLVVFLYRWIVLQKSPVEMNRREVGAYIFLFVAAVTASYLLNYMIHSPSHGTKVQEPFEYFFTQMSNGWRYLMLLFMVLPRAHMHPQPNFDYNILLNGIGFLAALIVALYFLIRHRRNHSLILFFFLMFVIYLMPTHSIIPKRSAFSEHQFYLPNLAMFFIAGYLLWRIPLKAFRSVYLVLLPVFAFASFQDLRLWNDPMELAMAEFQKYPQDSSVSCVLAEKARLCGDEKTAEALELDFYKREHNFYRFYPDHMLQRKLDFLMKVEQNAELLRQIQIHIEKYKLVMDETFYQYYLYALRANGKRPEYETVLAKAQREFPNQKFLSFLEQLPVKELIRRNPAYWGNVKDPDGHPTENVGICGGVDI